MNPQTILEYDGSFDGFLSCVFSVYEQKIASSQIRKVSQSHNELFTIKEQIITEKEKAKRVWDSFRSKTTRHQQKDFFKVFLSEIKGVENTLLHYMQQTFSTNRTKNIDYSNKTILKISQVARMVGREKHRMEAFVRFQLTKDEIYVATVEPDFNVLPLIIHHFKDRYADQKWLIYDTKRNYGIYYNLNTVEPVILENFIKLQTQAYAENEKEFQKLWKAYYDNVNIASRKNLKLHTQHLPKRYWKYLTEKMPM